MKKTVCFLLLLFLMCFMAACGSSKRSAQSGDASENNARGNDESGSAARDDIQTGTTGSTETGGSENAETSLQIKIGEQVFETTLYDNPSTQALVKLLPLELDMSEMNGNEKYFFLSDTLPTDSEDIGTIHEGDFMLYGDNCLVLFYKNFSTSYSYTPLGRVDNPEGFAEALGSGDVQVTFQVK